jgi:hypothetical protein
MYRFFSEIGMNSVNVVNAVKIHYLVHPPTKPCPSPLIFSRTLTVIFRITTFAVLFRNNAAWAAFSVTG